VGSTTGALGGTNAGSYDAFISKYDSSGTVQWTKQLGSSGSDGFFGVAIDSLGNVFAGGWIENGGLGSGQLSWLVKFNSSGTQQWEQKFAGGGYIKDIKFDSSNIIVSSLNSISRFSSSGTLLSTFSTPDLGWMDVDSSGNIFVSGYTTKSLGATNAGDYDIWLAKYNSSNTQQWIRQFGTSASDGSYGTAIDRTGNIYISGWTFGSLAATNPDQTVGGLAPDAWVAKYDTNGNRQWIKQSATPGIDQAEDMALDSAGNVFTIGYATNPLVSKYDSNGTQQWTKQLTTAGQSGSVRPKGIAIDNSGNLYATGATSSALEGAFAGGGFDIWVIKYQIEQNSGRVFNSTYGYGLVNAAAAVAQSLGLPIFADVPNIGGNNWGDDLVNAPEVWTRGYTGQGITVAVIDTGVDITHPDLATNIWRNTREVANNGIDDDANGYIDDVNGWNFGVGEYGNNVMPGFPSISSNGHGTHVAGTIAGLNNGFGVTGVAPNAKIMAIKLGTITTSGMNGDLPGAIRYAVDNGARVINMSIGTSDYTGLKDAIAYAASRGVITVSAAGNASAPTPGYPAAYATQYGIAVGAVDQSRTIAAFSNRAGTDNAMEYVVAPGVGIYSTLPGNTYESWNGTSMAAPNVAGVIALMLSANPNLTVSQVRQILANSTVGLNFSSQSILTVGEVRDLVF
jgi:subtilisin family serine protease